MPPTRAHVEDVRPHVASIALANLAAYQPHTGPTEDLLIYRSPLWERSGRGESRVGLTMLPRGFEESYYAGDAREALEGGALVDAVLADGARCVRAGMTLGEIRDRFGDPEASPSPVAAEMLAALEAWEAERYLAAVALPP